jgi:hypothetical protein
MTEDKVINAMMMLTEKLAADVAAREDWSLAARQHELSNHIVNLTHTVNTLRQEANYKSDTDQP